MTYGPGQHESKIIPYVINSLLQEKTPFLSSGAWAADWIFVDDVIDGIVSAATRIGIDGCVIDLGVGMLTSIHDVVELIVKLLNTSIEPRFGALPDRPGEQSRVAETKFAKAILGWSAKTSLEIGLAATIEWHKTHLQQSKKVE
jgi:nucleoside-diphosphate-sugar epimerase